MTRLALVTGGIRGIGKGISVALKSAGYDVIAAYNSNDEKAAHFSDETGIKCIKFDVSDFEQCGVALEKIKQSMGEVSVLINNAGITRDNAFKNCSLEDWQQVIDINLGGLFNMYGVTVNAIAPGYVNTEMFEAVPEKIKEKILAKIPVGRVGSIEEVARGVIFLAAEESGYITGSTLSINGGQYLQ